MRHMIARIVIASLIMIFPVASTAARADQDLPVSQKVISLVDLLPAADKSRHLDEVDFRSPAVFSLMARSLGL